MKSLPTLAVIALTSGLWGCNSTPSGPYGYTQIYLDERGRCANSHPPDASQVERFIRFYDQLRSGQVTDQIADIYAQDVYFNDTLVTLRDRETLAEHLQKTAEGLDTMTVTLLDVLAPADMNPQVDTAQPDATYLLWEMRAQFSLLGRDRLSYTLGISQLCFNQQGQVVFHQDFWDSSQGLDQHLPILGAPTRWLRKHPDAP